MSKWIRFKPWEKTWRSARMTLFNKINFYVGESSYWGIGFELSFNERSFTINLLKWYIGVEVWYGE